MVYYLGVMQAVIKRIAWLMQCTLGTSAAESLNTAGNIFIGQVCLDSYYYFFGFLIRERESSREREREL